MSPTPFTIDGDQVERLGAEFTGFVNLLLDVERAAQGLTGWSLRITSKDSTADGGVDAVLEEAGQTEWTPEGATVWQFKRSDLTPAKCRDEILGASFAHDLLLQGSSYVLALGARLTEQQIQRRLKKLREAASELSEDPRLASRIFVYDANVLARWASLYPSLLTYPALNAELGPFIPVSKWSAFRGHRFKWTPDPKRVGMVADLREVLSNPTGEVAIRVEGQSGEGKSRLVLEVAREADFEPLVMYTSQSEAFSPAHLNYLLDRKRFGILVLDECDRRRHEKVAEQLPVDGTVRLVSIGRYDDQPLSTPLVGPGDLDSDQVRELLQESYPTMPVEARRFAADRCEGNVGMALLIAGRLVREEAADAAELIRRGDVAGLLQIALPAGEPFRVAAAVALFRRIGWDEEKAYQADLAADFLGMKPKEFRSVAAELVRDGILRLQGRYRYVAPGALAVLMASEIWESRGHDIQLDLIPRLDRELLGELLTRAAELGRYQPSQQTLEELLGTAGPFGSLNEIEGNGLGEFLIQLAIIAPEKTLSHLERILTGASEDVLLQAKGTRRSLVWALEKLAWHTSSFERAADLLLLLAEAENESYANNATGTWVALFHPILPTTAAGSSQRLSYLQQRAAADEPSTRRLVVDAVGKALDRFSSAMVSAEDQGGNVIEPRGGAQTWDEVWSYLTELLDVLGNLARGPSTEIAEAAVNELLDNVLAHADSPLFEPLKQTLVNLPKRFHSRAAEELERSKYLVRNGNESQLATAIEELAAAFPAESPLEELLRLSALRPWDIDEEEFRSRAIAALSSWPGPTSASDLFDILASRELSAGWFLGRAIASVWPTLDFRQDLQPWTANNLPVVAGYLLELVEMGRELAFEEFDDQARSTLSSAERLSLIVRGPASMEARRRAVGIVEVSQNSALALAQLTGWIRHLAPDEVSILLEAALEPPPDQAAYNVLLDLLSFYIHARKELPDELRDVTWRLLGLRRTLRDLSNSRWDWGQLARAAVKERPIEVTALILDLISDGLVLLKEDQEADLLRETAQIDSERTWRLVTARLEQSDWRLMMVGRGWLVDAFPLETVIEWVGDSEERAVLVANVASAGVETLPPLAEWLLTHFENDDVGGGLAAEFSSGTWVGPHSGRLESQIELLKKWRRDDRSDGVKAWIDGMIEGLQLDRQHSLRNEEERGY